MRSFRIPLALFLLALVGCTSQPTSTAGLLPDGSVDAGEAALDIGAARQGVFDFLEGYANAAQDQEAQLARAVRAPQLDLWVQWLKVQNEALAGRLAGKADVRALRFIDLTDAQGTSTARFLLDASVSFTYQPHGGKPGHREFLFQGLVTLVKKGNGSWAVQDVTRDGQPMDSSIHSLGATSVRRGIGVALNSLFAFPHAWSVNLVIRNTTAKVLSLADHGTALVVETTGSRKILEPQSYTPTLGRIGPHTTVKGAVNFPPPDGRLQAFLFTFRTGGTRLPFRFSTGGPIPTPAATAAA